MSAPGCYPCDRCPNVCGSVIGLVSHRKARDRKGDWQYCFKCGSVFSFSAILNYVMRAWAFSVFTSNTLNFPFLALIPPAAHSNTFDRRSQMHLPHGISARTLILTSKALPKNALHNKLLFLDLCLLTWWLVKMHMASTIYNNVLQILMVSHPDAVTPSDRVTSANLLVTVLATVKLNFDNSQVFRMYITVRYSHEK